jgi:hypothetical protein
MAKDLTAFISYSHLDEHAVDRLTKHFSMLRRDGLVTEWHDQKILAGGDIDAEISKHLDSSDLFIPLLSPDFLASSYCYDLEMTRALERHDKGVLRIVPIVVQPCDWQNSPLGNLKALPKDGKPVSDWTNANSAWLDVVQRLRRLIEEVEVPGELQASPEKRAASSRYRAKRDFDDVDKMDFRESAFGTIRDYFKEASNEIASVADIKAKFSVIGDDGFTCTVVNRSRSRAIAHITVYSRTSRMSLGDISYAFSERAEPGTSNGWMQIEADDYELYLKINSMMSRTDEKEKFSPRQAAERLWEEFVGLAEITYG